MPAWIKAIEVFLLIVLSPLLSSQNSVAPQSANVPLFFMQPPETPFGVTGHPFHATVTANWKLAEPGGKVWDTEARGSIWRDAAGDVKMVGAKTRDGHAPAQLPSINVLVTARNMTIFRWTSESTNVTSFRSANLNGSNRFFEGLVVPKVFQFSRSTLYNCRESGVQCTTKPLGEKGIEGIRVNGTRYMETIPAASLGAPNEIIVTRDVWIDPAMDVVVEIDGKDPLFGDFEMRLSGVSAGPQDRELFEIPSGYRVGDITPPTRLPDVHY